VTEKGALQSLHGYYPLIPKTSHPVGETHAEARSGSPELLRT
jgi:hypothetical protein